MPSPIGHLLGGAVAYFIGRPCQQDSRIVVSATLLASVFPDFDFLPGILVGDPPAFHHGVSHSLGFALCFSATVFWVLRRLQYDDVAMRAALLAGCAYLLHAVLDAVSVGEGAKAVPLLWPFWSGEFGVNLGLFGHFHHDGLVDGVWSVVRRENLRPLVRELTVLGMPLLLLYFLRAKIIRTRVERIRKGKTNER